MTHLRLINFFARLALSMCLNNEVKYSEQYFNISLCILKEQFTDEPAEIEQEISL